MNINTPHNQSTKHDKSEIETPDSETEKVIWG